MSAAVFSRRSLFALPLLLAITAGLFMAPHTAQAVTVSAGQGPQYASIAVTYASTKACTAALDYINLAKTDPYYQPNLTSEMRAFRNDYWLYYQQKKITDAINASATKVTNLCANVTPDQDYSNITKDSQLSSTTTASVAGSANVKQLAQQAVALAKVGRCEEAEVMIDKAQSSMSLSGSGYVGQGAAVEVVNSLMQVRTLCLMTGQAATDASVATAAAGGADTTIAANKDEAQKRLETAYMLAQTTLAQARQGVCNIVGTLLPTIEERVPYYINGNVAVLTNNNIAAVKTQAESLCANSIGKGISQ